MGLTLVHTLNSGLCIRNGKSSVLIDVIHAGPDSHMNAMSDELLMDMRQGTGVFEGVSAVLFSHMHDDHFDEELLKEYMGTEHGKEVPVYAPGFSGNTMSVTEKEDGIWQAFAGVMTISLFEAPHIRGFVQDVPNCAMLISEGADSIFVAGDCEIDTNLAEKVMKYAGESRMTAVLNPFQIAFTEGQDFLRQVKPEKLYLYHIPDKQIDLNSYGMIARSTIRNFPDDLPRPEILKNMEEKTNEPD